jgi:hypothetical protein
MLVALFGILAALPAAASVAGGGVRTRGRDNREIAQGSRATRKKW